MLEWAHVKRSLETRTRNGFGISLEMLVAGPASSVRRQRVPAQRIIFGVVRWVCHLTGIGISTEMSRNRQ